MQRNEPAPPADDRRDWLAALLLRQPDQFAPRLVAALTRWRVTTRGFRRRLQRRLAATAAGAALLLTLTAGPLAPAAHAATITVDGVTCTLVDAILAANTDTATGGCLAGDAGLDTIDLQTDVTLTAAYVDFTGDTGAPVISSEIIIAGNGHTIERDGVAPSFRLLAVNSSGDLTLNDVTLSGGQTANNGGGVYVDQGKLQVYDSTLSGNATGNYGGGIANYQGTVTISRSYFDSNDAGDEGGGVAHLHGTMTITESTFTGNTAYDDGGAIVNYYGTMTIANSTFSGNSAEHGGAIYSYATLTIANSTFTDNSADYGGGIYSRDTLSLYRTVVSGNTANVQAAEVYNSWVINADNANVFSHDGLTSGDAYHGFTPGTSDINASDGAADIPLANILDSDLADNGGPTPTHNLVPGSPAVDLAPDADCEAPSPTNGVDQRGAPRPFDVVGQGNDGADTCDAGAVEFGSPVPPRAIFVSANAAGTTADGLAFGPEDILRWDGSEWTTFFDGSAAGLTPSGNAKHDINAFFVEPPGTDFILMSFAQNARTVPGIFGKVDGMDAVTWNGSYFQVVFDGQDVGLTNKTQEKIDALHLLPGVDAPPELIAAAGSCQVYMLVSTQGPGKVPNYSGGTLSFGGEDVLGFCFTSNGDNTSGKWIKVLDGSDQQMPRNSTDSISLSADGNTLYLTTRGTFDVDDATGGHSMVYTYDMTTEEFDGPIFITADEGLPKKVDGLQVE